MSDINEMIESGSVPLATPRKSKADLIPEPISENLDMDATAEDRPEVPDVPEVPDHDDTSSESSVEEHNEGFYLLSFG